MIMHPALPRGRAADEPRALLLGTHPSQQVGQLSPETAARFHPFPAVSQGKLGGWRLLAWQTIVISINSKSSWGKRSMTINAPSY